MSLLRAALLTATLGLAACYSGGESGEPGGGNGQQRNGGGTPTAPAPTSPAPTSPAPTSPAPTTPAPSPAPIPELSDREAVRFMQQASFGASPADIDDLKAKGTDRWFTEQLNVPYDSYTDRVEEAAAAASFEWFHLQTIFWERAINGDAQLRQRMMFALSQMLVISFQDEQVRLHRATYAKYADALQREALGNYCDLVREVSFSPIMGIYLSHLGNRKADDETGFVPDENYAREVMQLFTIGLEELDESGRPVGAETYTPDDVAGLASIFTGLSWAETDFDNPKVSADNRYSPMASYNAQHEAGTKSFMGHTVDVGSDAANSVNAALDFLLAHRNVAPFVSKQLIQKLVTSNPSPAYVRRVVSAFEDGEYTLANGTVVGTGRRCDMAATAAAILSDPEARQEPTDPEAGKVRSPLLRIAYAARAFRDDNLVISTGELPFGGDLTNLSRATDLDMNVFYSPSVFNDYRPGFVPSGSEAFDRGMVAPELQVETTQRTVGYTNIIRRVMKHEPYDVLDPEEYAIDLSAYDETAQDPRLLAETVDRIMTGGVLGEDRLTELAEILSFLELPKENQERRLRDRTNLAITLVASTPEYMVQR